MLKYVLAVAVTIGLVNGVPVCEFKKGSAFKEYYIPGEDIITAITYPLKQGVNRQVGYCQEDVVCHEDQVANLRTGRCKDNVDEPALQGGDRTFLFRDVPNCDQVYGREQEYTWQNGVAPASNCVVNLVNVQSQHDCAKQVSYDARYEWIGVWWDGADCYGIKSGCEDLDYANGSNVCKTGYREDSIAGVNANLIQ